MRIGSDFDNTIVDSIRIVCEWHNNSHGTDFAPSDFTTLNYWEVWGGTREDSIQKMSDFFNSEYHNQTTYVPGAYHGLFEVQKLLKQSKMSNNLSCIITSRSDITKQKTMELADELVMPRMPFYFVGHSDCTQESKGELAKSLGLDYFIDDSLHEVQDCERNGVKAILLTQPWNKNAYYHRRANNWNEVMMYLNEG